MFFLFGISNTTVFYSMRDVGQREYKDYLKNMDYDNIIQELTIEGVEWDIVNGRRKSFDAKDLTNIS